MGTNRKANARACICKFQLVTKPKKRKFSAFYFVLKKHFFLKSSSEYFDPIMKTIWVRLNDNGKYWRHVYKVISLYFSFVFSFFALETFLINFFFCRDYFFWNI